jgi:hypothetical protein
VKLGIGGATIPSGISAIEKKKAIKLSFYGPSGTTESAKSAHGAN